MKLRSDAGFTLAELLVSTLLTFFVMGAVYGVFRVQTRSIKSQESRLVAQEYSRAVLDMMVREIRNAAYTPTGAACAGIVAANAQTIQFTLDANGDGNCGGANEDITYTFSTAGCAVGFGNITRTDNNTGAPPPPQPLTNCNISSPGGNPGNNFALAYFLQNSTGPMALPVTGADLATIQRVQINLAVQSTSPDNEFGGGQLNAAILSNVELRNRGL